MRDIFLLKNVIFEGKKQPSKSLIRFTYGLEPDERISLIKYILKKGYSALTAQAIKLVLRDKEEA